MNSIKTNKHIL